MERRGGTHRIYRERQERWREREPIGENKDGGDTSCPSVGLIGEAEDAVGDDEVDDGEEGEAALLGLTSTSFFSFRSTCLLFVPESRIEGKSTRYAKGIRQKHKGKNGETCREWKCDKTRRHDC